MCFYIYPANDAATSFKSALSIKVCHSVSRVQRNKTLLEIKVVCPCVRARGRLAVYESVTRPDIIQIKDEKHHLFVYVFYLELSELYKIVQNGITTLLATTST
jgi:hypothetical protein